MRCTLSLVAKADDMAVCSWSVPTLQPLLFSTLCPPSDGKWRQSFQMMRRSFDKLCGIMEGVLRPQDVSVGAAVPLQMRVDIFLYHLVQNTELSVWCSRVKRFVFSFCRGTVSPGSHGLI